MNHPDELSERLPERDSPDRSGLLRACLTFALGAALSSLLFLALAAWCLSKLL